MNSERDHQPRGPAGARPSASDPPVPGPPPPPDKPAPARSEAAPAPSPEPVLPETEPPTRSRAPKAADTDAQTRPGPRGDISTEEVREHLRRRAAFLRELAEARELRRRVTPHRSRRERLHAVLRRRTFRIN